MPLKKNEQQKVDFSIFFVKSQQRSTSLIESKDKKELV